MVSSDSFFIVALMGRITYSIYILSIIGNRKDIKKLDSEIG